ncbi:MAG: DUF1679 domain-containing protein [Cyclobacteriaceae bacterium]|nr:DUF1679 domain-containing protein [Cyclobacteriaceae bacterium]
MNEHLVSKLKEFTGANDFTHYENLQTLWSGYGQIRRYFLKDADISSIIVKHILFPKGSKHPRGWNTSLSHQRKLQSYEVEVAWYTHWNMLTNHHCRTPTCYGVKLMENEIIIVLEDLDAQGFDQRRRTVNLDQMKSCLCWLAHFHAIFMGKEPEGLWNTGTYWHLQTRPDELKALDDRVLKNAASQIDQILKDSPWQTFVHGDAKLANFCFSNKSEQVAAVDFQYVGKGCGMKDVAYFIGSCLHEEDCGTYEKTLLDHYFACLRDALQPKQKDISFDDLEENWRKLFPVAWTDFHRFLKGWSPGHWKLNSYSEQMAQYVVKNLDKY